MNNKLIKISTILFILAITLLIASLVWVLLIEKMVIFKQQEQILEDAGKKYFSINSIYLPDKGEVRSISLQKLYDTDTLKKSLYIPQTTNLCDVNSWVKVYKNENGTYSYYTYLKCGNYESTTDHEGPVITLKGEDSIINSLGTDYSELGVKSVADDHDGKLDIKDVKIDSSKVDTKTVGTYEVTYKAYDKLRNVTKVIRKVTVIESLSERIKKDTNNSNLFVGIDSNNYVLFSGMLWQIVKINEDGTIKLVLFDNIANIPYGENINSYDDSNIKEWLNTVFYESIKDASKYVKQDSTWCIDTVVDSNSINSNCSTYSTESAVGMLSLADYKMTLDNNGYTYLFTRNSYRFINKSGTGNSWILFSNNNSSYYSYDDTKLVGVRPVINLNDSLYIIDGDGSSNDPFKLNDYSYGKENSKLSSRLTGEYISFSGYSWRVAGKDDDGNVKLIMSDTASKVGTSDYLTAGYLKNDDQRIFNPTEEGNLGYVVNNEIIDYIDDGYLVKHSFELPTFDSSKKYTDYTKTSFEAFISIPTTYDIFSGSNGNDSLRNGSYWLLDTQKGTPDLFIINQSNGITFTVDESLNKVNGLKLVVYIDGDKKISDGKGTTDDPYYIK